MMARRLCAAAALLFGLASPGCRDRDVVTESYATLADAVNAGAVERGWVPLGLPPSTQDLREAHDLDTNRRWGLFNFAPAEGELLTNLLVTSSDESWLETLRCDIPARIEWWPLMLRGSINSDKLKAAGLSTYRTRAGGLIMIVNWKQGRGYYWSE
jgi:hypothetical protein